MDAAAFSMSLPHISAAAPGGGLPLVPPRRAAARGLLHVCGQDCRLLAGADESKPDARELELDGVTRAPISRHRRPDAVPAGRQRRDPAPVESAPARVSRD